MQPSPTSLRLSLVLASLLFLAACGGPPPATSITASPSYLSFDGTSTATLEVTADGAWSVTPDVEWLSVRPEGGGAGRTTVTVTVDRAGLGPAHHAGSLSFTGAARLRTVTVSMRFPTVSGRLVEPSGRLSASSLSDVQPNAAQGLVPAGGGAEVVPGEYLVMLNDGMARVLEAAAAGVSLHDAQPTRGTLRAMAAGLAVDHGAVVGSPVLSPDFPLMLVNADPATAARLAADGRVRLVEPNQRWVLPRLQSASAEHDFGRQWHYEKINLAEAWDITEGDESVVVAVIDGGFATRHTDLRDQLLDGYDFVNERPEPSSESVCVEHGTHVAGTVAASRNPVVGTSGVAPGVKLRLMRVGYPEGDTPATEKCALDTLAVISAIRYAAGYEVGDLAAIPPVDVINLSLGSSGRIQALEQAVQTALAAGVSVVAASGNDGLSNAVYVPAAYDGVIGVAATNHLDARASYSNAGLQIDVAAPGGLIWEDPHEGLQNHGVLSLGWDTDADEENYVYMQGTSMATPHVAGVVALMRSLEPNLSPAAIVFLLRASAKDLGAPGPDNEYGWGMVDAAAVLRLMTEASWGEVEGVTVRLRAGSEVVASAQADPSGGFDLGQVPPGSYVLEAGTGRADAGLEEFGAFFASREVVVSADLSADLELALFGDAR